MTTITIVMLWSPGLAAVLTVLSFYGAWRVAKQVLPFV